MGHKTFDMILHLASKGYTVSFSKAEGFRPATVLRLELTKGQNHHVELVDISIKNMQWTALTTDEMIVQNLRKAEWEFEYDFEREE